MNRLRITIAVLLLLVCLLLAAPNASAQVSPTSPIATLGGSAISGPVATYVDVYGNIFVTNASSVSEIPVNGGPVVQIATGLTPAIKGVAADSMGNVYVTQTGVTTILEILAGGGSTTLGNGLHPVLITLDAADNLYVSDSSGNRVVKIAPGTNSQTVLPFTGLNNPHGIAVDAAGDVFVTNYNSTTTPITELTASGTQITLPITGLANAYGIAVDATGDLFVMDSGNKRLLEYPAPINSANSITLVPNVLTGGTSVVLSPRGDVIFNNSGKVYAIENSVANFYGTPVLSTSGVVGLTFTMSNSTTLGNPTYRSNNSATAFFKSGGAGITATTCTINAVLAANASCILNVAFAPQQAGPVSGVVVLNDNTGTAIATAFLTGVGDAPVPAFSPGTQSTFLPSLGMPTGVTLDAGGNLYTADSIRDTVTKTTSAGVSTTLAFTGLSRPSGVAVDGAGSVYVSDSSNNAVYKLPIGGVSAAVPTSGLSAPMGIALDGLNNLYIADSGNGRVVRVDASGLQSVIPFTGLANPTWVAVDTAGNVFVSDSGTVFEYSTATKQQTTVSTTGLAAAAGLALSPNGTLFIADSGNGNVFVLPPGGASFTLAGGLGTPAGLAYAANGNLYIADSSAGQVALLDRTTDTVRFPPTASGGTSSPLTVTVQNTGNSSLDYSGITVSSGFAQQTPLAATDCSGTATVLPAATCNVNVTFSPTTLGTVTGTVLSTDNALNASAATQTIQLTGTGIRATTTSLAMTTPATGNPVYGQSVTVTATIAPGSGTGTPTGTVSFALDGAAPGAPVPLTGDQAANTLTGLSAGSHTITATYSGDGTFATSTSSLSITVTAAPLTVTATSQSRMYNVANQPLAATISGFVYSDTSAVVSGVAGLTTTATTTSAPGTYPITITLGNLAAANYSFNLVPGTITVTEASNTITFPAIASTTYGAGRIALKATVSSGLPITYSVLSGPATVSSATGTAAITGAGTVTIAANQPGNTNYVAATQVTQTFTVAPAVLTVTADSLSKEAGQANPALTYSITGFVNADSASVVSGNPTLSTAVTTSSTVGSYPITIVQGGLSATNYTFNLVPGLLVVTGTTPQKIIFGSLPGVTYGNAPITLTATASSGAAVTYTVTGPATLSGGNTLAITGIGTVYVTASQLGNNTYSGAISVTRSFYVGPAILTVAAVNVSRNINTSNPMFTYTITGFVNSDTASVVVGTPTLSTLATTSSPVGSYSITIAQGSLSAANYTFAFSPAILTITALPQTITFAALPNVTYGAAPIALAATTTSSLPVSYTVSGPATLNGTTLSVTGAGEVSVTACQAGNATYAEATSITEKFTVVAAPLTVTATNVVLPFGSPIPTTFAYVITGFVNSDTASVINGFPALATTATATSPGGVYPITPSLGTLTTANYTFLKLNPGTLTISPAGQTIVFAALPNIPQTTTSVTLTATASSGLPVSFSVVSGPAKVQSNVLTITGPGKVVVSAIQAGDSSYSAATPVTQSFTVTGTTTATVTSTATTINLGSGVTLTGKVTGKISGSVPSGTVSFYTGTTLLGTTTMVNGAASLYTTSLPSGSITVTASYSGDTTFTASNSTALAILVISPDFDISATTNLTIAAGQIGTTTITLTPVGGYSQTVSFACGTLPVNVSCSFSPPALNFYPGTGAMTLAQSTTLTVSTSTAQSTPQNTSRLRDLAPREVTLAAFLFGTPVFALSCLFGRGRRLLQTLRLLSLLLVLGAIGGLSGCGSHSSTEAISGTYNIPVTFNDGTSVTHTLTITVTIP